MATRRKQNNGVRAAAVLGGGALVLWLIGHARWGRGGTTDAAALAPSAVTVRIRSGDRLDLDGADADLSTVVARARAMGMARVVAVGDAREGWVVEVMRALEAAGVAVGTSLRNGTPARQPRTKVPRYDERKGWRGGDARTLYAFVDPATGRVAVRPGGFDMPFGPQATARIATRDEAERYWQSPLHAGWTTAG